MENDLLNIMLNRLKQENQVLEEKALLKKIQEVQEEQIKLKNRFITDVLVGIGGLILILGLLITII